MSMLKQHFLDPALKARSTEQVAFHMHLLLHHLLLQEKESFPNTDRIVVLHHSHMRIILRTAALLASQWESVLPEQELFLFSLSHLPELSSGLLSDWG